MTQIKEVTSHLLYASESEYPFQPFLLEAAGREAFSVKKLLQAINLLQLQRWNHSCHRPSDFQSAASRAELIPPHLNQVLQAHLTNLQIYWVGQKTPGDEGWHDRGTVVFPLLLGQTPVGDWIGVCPKFRADAAASDARIRPTLARLLIHDSAASNSHTLQLISQLKEATARDKLPVQSANSQEQVADFWWKAADTRDVLITELLESTSFLKRFPFQGFSNCLVDGYRPEQLTQHEKAFYKAFAPLDRVLRSHLTDLQEYIIGGYNNFHLYVIGRTTDGDWAGVATQAIWT